MAIIVYSKPVEQCVQCRSTYTALDKFGIKYVSYDVTLPENSGYLEKIVDMGYASVPVVLDTESDIHWSGFRPDLIKQHLT